MEYRDYYKTLGVNQSASQDEIKSAYRKLAMQYHPDRNQGDPTAEDKFKEINEAYQVLSDPEARTKYDRLGNSYQDWKQHGGQGDFNWSHWTQPGGSTQYTTADMNAFSDFFTRIFGAGFGGGRDPFADLFNGGAQQMPQLDQPVEISLQEAYQGTQRSFMVGNRHLTVKIPPGARTGTKVRVKGGGPNNRDFYLVITVSEDAQFERDGDDLTCDVHVDLFTAVLGGSATVKTMTNTVNLKIPASTQPGSKIRLKGKGMPRLKAKGQFGDLYVRVQVTLPRHLSGKQKQLFEELRKSA
jgi:curved DNA-binding protein